VRLREDPRELRPEEALAAQAGEERPEPAAQDLLRRGEAGGLEDHAAVEEQHSAQVHLQAVLEVACEQLGRHRRPHVVRDEDHRLAHVPAPDRLHQVGLAVQRVDVVVGLADRPKPRKSKHTIRRPGSRSSTWRQS